MSTFHYSNLRVKFEGEEGSGPGVNRGFFAAVANALKTDEKVNTRVLFYFDFIFKEMRLTLSLNCLNLLLFPAASGDHNFTSRTGQVARAEWFLCT